VDDLRQGVATFIETYNDEWLIERLGHRTGWIKGSPHGRGESPTLVGTAEEVFRGWCPVKAGAAADGVSSAWERLQLGEDS
jgi:hypothetical protein